MGTVASDSGGGEFKLAPAGAHAAVCDQVVDLGIQPGGRFDPRQEVYLRFQVPSERVTWKPKDGPEQEGPMVIGRRFSLSLGSKAHLRAFLENWRGRPFTKEELKGFDIKNVLGKPALIQVIHKEGHNGKIYARISTAMTLPKGMPHPQLEGEALYYDSDRHDPKVFEKLSKRTREKIGERLTPEDAIKQMAHSDGQGPDHSTLEEYDDDIPF